MTLESYERLKQALIEQNKRAKQGKLDPELDSVIVEYFNNNIIIKFLCY